MPISFPQRFNIIAKPGDLLKRQGEGRGRIIMLAATERDPVYLARVRMMPCLRCGVEPCGEAAHVRRQSGTFNKRGGMGKRPADRFALPLCRGCHTADADAQHRVGEALFWLRVGLNPLLVCERLYPARGDLVAMRAVVLRAIAERVPGSAE
jgi:hypothetical protein